MEKFSGNVSQLCSTGKLNPLADYLGMTNLGGAIKAALMAARLLDSKKYAQAAVEAARLLGEISPDNRRIVFKFRCVLIFRKIRRQLFYVELIFLRNNKLHSAFKNNISACFSR